MKYLFILIFLFLGCDEIPEEYHPTKGEKTIVLKFKIIDDSKKQVKVEKVHVEEVKVEEVTDFSEEVFSEESSILKDSSECIMCLDECSVFEDSTQLCEFRCSDDCEPDEDLD